MDEKQLDTSKDKTLVPKSAYETAVRKKEILHIAYKGIPRHELSTEVLDAHRQVTEAVRKLKSLKPVEPSELSFEGKVVSSKKEFKSSTRGSIYLNSTFLGAGLFLLSSGFAVPFMVGASAISSFFLLRTVGSLYNPYSTEHQGLKKIASRIFLSKKKRAKLDSYYEKQKEYDLAVRAYQELINAKREALNKSRVLEIITNDSNNRYMEKMLELTNNGNIIWVDKKEPKKENNAELTSQIIKELESEYKKLGNHTLEIDHQTDRK